ncbi:MAG TPA: 6-hydroxymethylpterin diphosphokinase MptE-like protein [Rectinemataceae bacterium]|nr:6-hydroxymethylpterin diphosphokinase MptE-like protein [Rectinemataceae bacterium]
MKTEPEAGWFALNLALLSECQPELAAYLEEIAVEPLELVDTKSGYLTARLKGRWLHSSRDPVAEASRIATASIDPASDTAIVLGAGLGWTIEASLLRPGIERVVVCEADPAKLAAMLSSRDLRPILADPRLTWMVGGDPGALLVALSECGAKLASLLSLASLESFDADWYRGLREAFSRWKAKEEINANTLGRFGRLWIRNLARNSGSFAGFPGIEGLAQTFAEIPALVVAAGPSLDAILPFLGELRQRCLIVAVDTALRSLLRAGQEPDFLVVVDPQYWNWRHIADLEAPSACLVSEPAVFPPALRRRQRAIFLAESLFPLGRILAGPGRGLLGAGGSVATSAWDLARHLGASTIFMAGLDLGYPGGHTHAKASLFEQRALASGSRLLPGATAQAAALFGAPGDFVPANDGGLVFSDQRMALYAWWFEARLARREGAATKTLSAGGRAIPGMGFASIEEVLALPLKRTDIDRRLAQVVSIRPAAETGERLATALEGLLVGLRRIEAAARRGVEAARAGREGLGRGLSPKASLAILTEVDAELSLNEVRDVAGFLLPSLRDLAGRPPSDLEGSLAQSEGLYAAILSSTSEQLALLEGEQRSPEGGDSSDKRMISP